MKKIQELDANGNCTHYRDEHGYETWYEYDENSNLLYRKEGDKEGDGIEQFFEYDENDNQIHFKQIGGILDDGFEQWYKYDEKGRLIHYRNSKGEQKWYKHVPCGEKVRIKREEFEALKIG